MVLAPPIGDLAKGDKCLAWGNDQIDGLLNLEPVVVGADHRGGGRRSGQKTRYKDEYAHVPRSVVLNSF